MALLQRLPRTRLGGPNRSTDGLLKLPVCLSVCLYSWFVCWFAWTAGLFVGLLVQLVCLLVCLNRQFVCQFACTAGLFVGLLELPVCLSVCLYSWFVCWFAWTASLFVCLQMPVHPDAGVVRCLPLYGRVVAEGHAAGWPSLHHPDASQVPTRPALPEARPDPPCPHVHSHPGALSHRVVGHQVHQVDIDRFSYNGTSNRSLYPSAMFGPVGCLLPPLICGRVLWLDQFAVKFSPLQIHLRYTEHTFICNAFCCCTLALHI